MNEVARFIAHLPIDDARKLSTLIALVNAGDVAGAVAWGQANAGPIGNVGGAIEMWLPKPDATELVPYDPAVDVSGRDFPLAPGGGVSMLVMGPCNAAARVPDGIHVFVSFSAAPGEYIEGQGSHGNGTANVQVPAGRYFCNVKLGDEMTQTVPANLYAKPWVSA